METENILPKETWAIDANPENNPTYPIKDPEAITQVKQWQRPVLQPVTTEVLHSNERPDIPAVYGSTLPPSGLSGVLRRRAFKYSESHLMHWMTLLMADRINVVEGILSDLSKGHLPNFFTEAGGKAKWKYNKRQVLVKAGGTLALIAGVAGLVIMSKRKAIR